MRLATRACKPIKSIKPSRIPPPAQETPALASTKLSGRCGISGSWLAPGVSANQPWPGDEPRGAFAVEPHGQFNRQHALASEPCPVSFDMKCLQCDRPGWVVCVPPLKRTKWSSARIVAAAPFPRALNVACVFSSGLLLDSPV